MFGEFGFVSGHPAVVGLSSTPECVFFFSSITNLGPLVVLFLVPVLCSSVCVWLSQLSAWLGWSGSLRFSCAWVLIEPVWFWSYGRNTGGTGWTGSVLGWGVFTGLFEETCLQVLFKCWSSHLHNVMEIMLWSGTTVGTNSSSVVHAVTGNSKHLSSTRAPLWYSHTGSHYIGFIWKNLHHDHVTRILVPGIVWFGSTVPTGCVWLEPARKSWLVILGAACVSVLWVASELEKNN